MAKIAKKVGELDFIRLECTKGCGKVRRDVKNNPEFSITKAVMKKFNVQNPEDLQKVYVCMDCQRGRKKEEKVIETPVYAPVPTYTPQTEQPKAPTPEELKEQQNIGFLVPQQESNYISRKIRNKSDINILETAYAFNVENAKNPSAELINVLLCGDCGSGKTHFARFFAYKTKLPYKRINLNGATTPEDLVGQYVPNPNDRTFRWVDGWLTKFMRHGGVFVLDEINMAQADILAILNSVLDRERTLVLTQKDGEVVKAHPHFFVISTMNLNYEGTKPLNEALKDRFSLSIEFDYDRKVESKLITNEKILDFAEKLRLSYEKQEIITPVSTRTLLALQRNIEIFGKEVAEENLFNRFEKQERKVVSELWKTISGSKTSSKTEDEE